LALGQLALALLYGGYWVGDCGDIYKMTSDKPMARLLEIMARLRDPVTGCPWDLKQTFVSVAPYTLEEAFEVVDAIEQGDLAELREELGDLLLQVVFHARIAEELGAFDFADVAAGICDKMVRRHPHVFGAKALTDEAALQDAWERHKRQEWADKRDGAAPTSLLEGVSKALPALVSAEKLQRRAARGGFDWDRPEPVLQKIEEELEECREALAACAGAEKLTEEVGDLLFSCVNLARHLGIDAEQSLRAANAKFARRFRCVEQRLAADGLRPAAQHQQRMESAWEACKAAAKGDDE
jgi:ATP diphosphatase